MSMMMTTQRWCTEDTVPSATVMPLHEPHQFHRSAIQKTAKSGLHDRPPRFDRHMDGPARASQGPATWYASAAATDWSVSQPSGFAE